MILIFAFLTVSALEIYLLKRGRPVSFASGRKFLSLCPV